MKPYNRNAFVNIRQMVYDTLFILLALPISLAVVLWLHPDAMPLMLLWVPLLFLLAYLSVMHGRNLYEMTSFSYQDRTLRNVLASCAAGSLLCLLVMPFTRHNPGSNDFLAFFCFFASLLLSLQYMFRPEAARQSKARFAPHVLFIGNADMVKDCLYYLTKTVFRQCHVGYVPLDAHESVPNLPLLGSLKDVLPLLSRYVVDEIVMAVPQRRMPEVEDTVRMLEERGVTVKLILNTAHMETVRNTLFSLGRLPVLMLHSVPVDQFQQVGKRIMDIIGALLGLVPTGLLAIFLLPILRLQNKRPTLVGVPCLGVGGRTFNAWQFNCTGTDTGLGKWLTRTRLYRIPRLWNVLTGDMSLVGVRPIQADEQDVLQNRHFRRLSVKPGLTGLWHVCNHKWKLDFEGIYALDMSYIDKWNLLLDFSILFGTVFVGLLDRILVDDREDVMLDGAADKAADVSMHEPAPVRRGGVLQ